MCDRKFTRKIASLILRSLGLDLFITRTWEKVKEDREQITGNHTAARATP